MRWAMVAVAGCGMAMMTGWGAVGQTAVKPAVEEAKDWTATFRLDDNRPFAYAEVLYVGPRYPWSSTEPQSGIYARFHNNSKLTIIVDVFSPPPQPSATHSSRMASSIALMDEVVAIPPFQGEGGDDRQGPGPLPNTPPYIPGMGVPAPPASPETSSKTNDEKISEMPLGYGFVNRTAIPIAPGGVLDFSLPVNHVGDGWYARIPFRFDLRIRSPFNTPQMFAVITEHDVLAASHAKGTKGNATH